VATLTATMEDTLLIRARELRAMIEDPACDNRTRQQLARGYFRLVRSLRERGIGGGLRTRHDRRREPHVLPSLSRTSRTGRSAGGLELHARQTPAFGHLRIDCLRRIGNTVYASGRITQASIPVMARWASLPRKTTVRARTLRRTG
jgi:hypothetical protein